MLTTAEREELDSLTERHTHAATMVFTCEDARRLRELEHINALPLVADEHDGLRVVLTRDEESGRFLAYTYDAIQGERWNPRSLPRVGIARAHFANMCKAAGLKLPACFN